MYIMKIMNIGPVQAAFIKHITKAPESIQYIFK